MSSAAGLLATSRRLLRRRAVAVDMAVAVALTVGAVWAAITLRHDSTVTITVVSALLCTTAVAWRRLKPVPAALVALTSVAAYQISGHDSQGAFVTVAIALACYLVGRSAPSRWQLAAVAAYALAATTIVQIDYGFSLGSDLLTWGPLAIAPMIAGIFVARRDALARDLAEARTRVRGERDLARERAVADERTRVARELHDVVSHCVSVMVIQAGAARLLAPSDAATARAAMRVVASSGREALSDLRRVVGTRRHDADAMDAATPGLAQLTGLAERASVTGADIRLHIDLTEPLRADLDLDAFRIVQEALTNARKHAPTATVSVTVSITDEQLHIDVEDSGASQATPMPSDAGSGHGIAGMRERAALHGGHVDARPLSRGGFAVQARLPLISQPNTPGAANTHAADATPVRRPIWRRWWPFALVVAAAALTAVFAPRALGPLTLFVGAFAVAVFWSIRSAVVGIAVLSACTIAVVAAQHQSAGVALGASLAAGAVWIGGRVVRDQRELVSQLRATTAVLSAERDARAAAALQDERVRIARDLHTIVAGLVTTMVIQAEAVDQLLDSEPAAAVEGISAIEQTGREALTQLRQMLGVLRNRLDPAPRSPSLDTMQPQITPAAAAVAS